MISSDKVTEVLCILDEFCKNLDAEWTKILHVAPVGEGYHNPSAVRIFIAPIMRFLSPDYAL